MNEDTNLDMLELATPLIQNKGQWNEHGNTAARIKKCCHQLARLARIASLLWLKHGLHFETLHLAHETLGCLQDVVTQIQGSWVPTPRLITVEEAVSRRFK